MIGLVRVEASKRSGYRKGMLLYSLSGRVEPPTKICSLQSPGFS